MTIHMIDWTTGMSPKQVVLRALDVDKPESIDLTLERFDGPEIDPYPTRWYRWSLPPGMNPVQIDSVLNEGDPDDAPYPCNNGFVAILTGSKTAYVHTATLDSVDLKDAVHNLVTTAEHPFFSPRPAGLVGEA